MEKRLTHKGRTVHEYQVTGFDKDTTDYDLIQFCDEGNFGGRVVRHPSGQGAHVYVYVD